MSIKVARKCRYCMNCLDGINDGDYYCMLTNRDLSKNTANRKNDCSDFRFTKYDSFTGKAINEKEEDK